MGHRPSRFIALLLVLFSSQMIKAAGPSAKDVSFLPMTISISCSDNTSLKNQVHYLRASDARPEIDQNECIDKAKTIDNVFPNRAEIEYSESFHIWLVAIILKDKDALALRKLSADNLGALMVISVDHRALAVSQLGAPLRGNKTYINAESKSDAHNLMMSLVKS